MASLGHHRQAVEADHAAAHVDYVALHVDAFCLADVFTPPALYAPVRVDVDTHGAVAAHASEYGADWAERVAEYASAPPCRQMIAIAAVSVTAVLAASRGWVRVLDDFCIQPERFEPTGGAMALNAISRKMPSDRVRSHSIGLE